MEHKVVLWVIWSISAFLFIIGAMALGLFAFASLGAQGSLMEQDYYRSYFCILFIGLPLFQLSTIIFIILALRHGPPLVAYLIVFLPYLLVPCIVVIGEHKGKAVSKEAKKLSEAFYSSPRLNELENRRLKLEFYSDTGNVWPNTLQQMVRDGFVCREDLGKKASLQELTIFYYRWDELSTEQTFVLQGYVRGNDTIYSGKMPDSGNFLLAATPEAGEYLRSIFISLPWPKFDKAALQEIWRSSALTSVSQFLQFWPSEKGDSCREVFVEIEQALRQGSNARATMLYRQTGEKGFWDNIPYSPADSGNVEDIEFWMYEHIVRNHIENLEAAYFFSYESESPLLSTADSLRFLRRSDANLLKVETPEEIHHKAQQQYDYRTSPPPSNVKEYIQYIRKMQNKNEKGNPVSENSEGNSLSD